MKTVKLFFIAIFGYCTLVNASTKMTVENLKGDDYSNALAAIGRLEMKGDVLKVISKSGEVLYQSDLYSSKVVFGESTSVNDAAAITITAAPNPATERITIEGVAENEPVHVFDTNGKLLLSATTPTVDFSSLKKGVYLLQVKDQLLKVIKK